MDCIEMLFALQVHQNVDAQLRAAAERNSKSAEEFITPELYTEYTHRYVRRLATTAEIIRGTPLEKKAPAV